MGLPPLYPLSKALLTSELRARWAHQRVVGLLQADDAVEDIVDVGWQRFGARDKALLLIIPTGVSESNTILVLTSWGVARGCG